MMIFHFPQFPPTHLISKDETTSQNQEPEQESTEHKEPLPLPAPTSKTEEPARQLNVGGDALKLDDLGPMVVNSDGTLSRIHNWAEMTPLERERTVRILGKRNMLRREALGRENVVGEEGK